MNKKLRKKLLLAILVLLLIVLVGFAYIANANKRIDEDFQKTKARVYKEMKEEMVMPIGTFTLKKNYEGKNNTQDFYKTIYNVSRELLTISQKTIKDPEKYYEENKGTIRSTFGISNKEKVVKIIEYVKTFERLRGFNDATIEDESVKKTYNYLQFNLIFRYDDTKELKFKVNFMNSENESVVAKYEVAE